MHGILAVWQPESFPQLLGAAAIWAILGILILVLGYKIFDFIMPGIRFDEQLAKGNIALAIVIAAFLLGVAIIIHAAIV